MLSRLDLALKFTVYMYVKKSNVVLFSIRGFEPQTSYPGPPASKTCAAPALLRRD